MQVRIQINQIEGSAHTSGPGTKGQVMKGGMLKNMLGRVADRGGDLVKKPTWGRAVPTAKQSASAVQSERIEGLCRALLSGRGEASGVALASKVLDRYATMS